MVNISQKIAKSVEKTLPIILNNTLEEEVKNIIDIGIDTYEDLLFGTVVSRGSMADPENFYDAYVFKLETYKFIDEEDTTPVLYIPDVEDFRYEGTLTILQFIVEGVSGIYLELSETDLKEVLNNKGLDDKVKRRLRNLPGIIDTDVPINSRFRLMPTRGTLSTTVQDILNKKLVTFPFSNSSPVDLFTPMQDYVDENMDKWVNDSIKETLKLVKQRYN